MQLYLGKTKISGVSVYKDGNMPGFLMTENGDMAYLTTEQQLERTPLTATAAKDIRKDTVAITNDGIVTGEKNFPSYETTKGYTAIMPGEKLEIVFYEDDQWNYTSLQAIVCTFNTNMNDSTSAEQVAIEDKIYSVKESNALSNVIKDDINKVINLGVINNWDVPAIIRYYTYREID